MVSNIVNGRRIPGKNLKNLIFDKIIYHMALRLKSSTYMHMHTHATFICSIIVYKYYIHAMEYTDFTL